MAWQYEDALYHHGVKGMKWGVRRYQNEDGTWTDAGKRHRDDAESGPSKQSRPKKVSTMSRDEYKKGLRKATITGGLIGRALYKRKNAGSVEKEQKREDPSKDTKKEPAKPEKVVTKFKADGSMKINSTDSNLTKQVKRDYNKLSEREFREKYVSSKKQYAKRVEKSSDGDPLAKHKGNKAFKDMASAELGAIHAERVMNQARLDAAFKQTAVTAAGGIAASILQKAGYENAAGVAALAGLAGGFAASVKSRVAERDARDERRAKLLEYEAARKRYNQNAKNSR